MFMSGVLLFENLPSDAVDCQEESAASKALQELPCLILRAKQAPGVLLAAAFQLPPPVGVGLARKRTSFESVRFPKEGQFLHAGVAARQLLLKPNLRHCKVFGEPDIPRHTLALLDLHRLGPLGSLEPSDKVALRRGNRAPFELGTSHVLECEESSNVGLLSFLHGALILKLLQTLDEVGVEGGYGYERGRACS